MQKTLISIIIVLLLSACENQGGEGSPNQNTNIDTRPNIILIVADDMGYSDIGSFGGEISTPNLDDLAAGGVRLSNFYAASTCSPTRSMLLSGVSNHKAGMGTMFGDQTPNQLGQKGYEGHMNFNVVSIASLLKDAGYHTYMTGKWHLGYEEELSPKARGFEQSFVLLNGGAGHFDDSPLENTYDKASFRDNGLYTSLPDDFYSSEFYTDKLIEYIDNNQNDGKPFFGYLAYTAPHWPLQAPDEYIEKYKGKYDDGYSNLKERRLQSMINLGLTEEGVDIVPSYSPDTANWDSLSEEDKKRRAREMEVYAAMVDNMDFHIGRLLSYLEKSGMRSNTLIVFMSDNGPSGANTGRVPIFSQEWIDSTFDNSFDNMGKKNSYIYYGPHWAEASVVPSKLFKGFTTEGGIKVPSIINFKGKLGNLEGQFQDEFMTILDLAPTFLELAETKPLGTQYKGRDVYPHVGKSIVPFLRGKSDKVHDENEVMIWELNRRIAVRQGDWKLLKLPKPHGTGDWQLYNLSSDPGETNDIRSENIKKAEELIAAWETYVVENGVIMPE